MTTQEAIDILKKINAWRRGDIDEYPYTPNEIGHAIDRGIHALESVCSDGSAAEACADKFLEIKGFVEP